MLASKLLGRSNNHCKRVMTTCRGAYLLALCIACAIICALNAGLLESSALAGTAYVDGVSDQSLHEWSPNFSQFFKSTWVASGHIKYARFFFQWNGMSKGEEGSVEASFKDAANMGLGIDLSLTVYPKDPFPGSMAEYQGALEGFLSKAKEKWGDPVAYVEPWNEPNAQGELKDFPAVDAEYTVAAHAACEKWGCTIIAGNFFDGGEMAPYEKHMIERLKEYTSWKPSVWGIHPYQAVKNRSATSVEEFKQVLAEKHESTQMIFSEVGAFHCTSNGEHLTEEEQMNDASYLTKVLTPMFAPQHVFYYEFDPKNNEPPECSGKGADTSLFVPSGESEQIFRPREAAGPIYAGTRAPWAFTTGASRVTGISANLTGVAFPVGTSTLEATPATENYFQWGLSTSYEHSTSAEPVATIPDWETEGGHHASTTISGLTPGLTYHYRMVAVANGQTSYGEDKIFATPLPPEAASGAAVEVQEKQAVLQGDVNPRGKATTYYFEYGLTTAYGSSTAVQNAGSGTTAIAVKADVGGLEPGTTYHYRVVATNDGGTSYSSDATLRTLMPKPAVVEWKGTRHIYYRGLNGQLHEWYWNGAEWSQHLWGYQGEVASNPSAVVHANGSIDVYYRTATGQLGQWWFGPNWSSEWTQNNWGYSNQVESSPAAVALANGDTDVYYRSATGQLGQWWFGPNWSSEWSQNNWGYAGGVVGTPSAITHTNNDVDVYYRTATGQLGQWWFGPNWSSEWTQNNWGYEHVLGGDPSAIQLEGGGEEIYYGGSTAEMWAWYINGSSWNLATVGPW